MQFPIFFALGPNFLLLSRFFRLSSFRLLFLSVVQFQVDDLNDGLVMQRHLVLVVIQLLLELIYSLEDDVGQLVYLQVLGQNFDFLVFDLGGGDQVDFFPLIILRGELVVGVDH